MRTLVIAGGTLVLAAIGWSWLRKRRPIEAAVVKKVAEEVATAASEVASAGTEAVKATAQAVAAEIQAASAEQAVNGKVAEATTAAASGDMKAAATAVQDAVKLSDEGVKAEVQAAKKHTETAKRATESGDVAVAKRAWEKAQAAAFRAKAEYARKVQLQQTIAAAGGPKAWAALQSRYGLANPHAFVPAQGSLKPTATWTQGMAPSGAAFTTYEQARGNLNTAAFSQRGLQGFARPMVRIVGV